MVLWRSIANRLVIGYCWDSELPIIAYNIIYYLIYAHPQCHFLSWYDMAWVCLGEWAPPTSIYFLGVKACVRTAELCSIHHPSRVGTWCCTLQYTFRLLWLFGWRRGHSRVWTSRWFGENRFSIERSAGALSSCQWVSSWFGLLVWIFCGHWE